MRKIDALDDTLSTGSRFGRTQSAVSLQVQRLEAVVGRTLIARGKGDGVELTAHAAVRVERGRALLALNDDILKAVGAQPANAAVRLRVDSCYSRRLPDILARLAATHPHVTVEVARAASCELGPMLKANSLDLMLCADGLEPRQWPAVEVWRGPLAWIVSDGRPRQFDDPLALALSPPDEPDQRGKGGATMAVLCVASDYAGSQARGGINPARLCAGGRVRGP
jgi:DNA-binding transcriptional LysR family regulator